MPLSNPTSRSEARPQDLADWTEGRALAATRFPFPPMRVGDASIPVAQCNSRGKSRRQGRGSRCRRARAYR